MRGAVNSVNGVEIFAVSVQRVSHGPLIFFDALLILVNGAKISVNGDLISDGRSKIRTRRAKIPVRRHGNFANRPGNFVVPPQSLDSSVLSFVVGASGTVVTLMILVNGPGGEVNGVQVW